MSQAYAARRLIDGGIDLVHGHSSHHVRPIEVYRDRLILYGCGDLIDDYEGIAGHGRYRGDLGLMYFRTLEVATGRLLELAGVLEGECAVPAECAYSRLAGCDLLGLGSGVSCGRVYAELLQWVRNLPDNFARDLPVFIFTTSWLPFLATFWHWPLKHALTKKGCRILGEFACRSFDTWGPLWLTGGRPEKECVSSALEPRYDTPRRTYA